jgi:glyoxylase-like metal-dependent hydrolase (beta-lactamase superfamily II)
MGLGEIWQELGDGVFRRHYQFLDQNIGAVLGAEAVLVVDSRANPELAQELRDDLGQLSSLPVGWVFDTHYHWDHSFGNQAFTEAELWGHQACQSELRYRGEAMLEDLISSLGVQEQGPYLKVVITPPTETFVDSARIDLGNRVVELAYLGRGHTNSDAVLHVDGVTFAGDLIEEGAPPAFADSFPLAWVDTLAALHKSVRTLVVPGHGGVVSPAFVAGTREQLQWLADTARVARAHRLPVEAVDLTGAPYPEQVCREALRRAYEELSSMKFSQ